MNTDVDGENCRDDNGLEVIVKDWLQISQGLATKDDYLILKIKTERFNKQLISHLQRVIALHNIATIDRQLYRDKKMNHLFMVFKLRKSMQAISFESLYFDLPTGVDFHFLRRSPITNPSQQDRGHLF